MAIVIELPRKLFFGIDKKFKTAGFAMFPFIFISDKDDEELLYHEKVHIRQQLRGLIVFFLIKYLYYLVKYGYWDNPYEVEARREAANHMQRKNRYRR